MTVSVQGSKDLNLFRQYLLYVFAPQVRVSKNPKLKSRAYIRPRKYNNF